jgi:phage terminase large subunit GpA-like protein
MVLTAGVDVQHDRLAIIIRAWGRGNESWLVYWGEIHGQTLIENAGAWVDLDALLTTEFMHASGNTMTIRAASIDSSDGRATDAVYAYVRKRQGRNYMAIKGASEQTGSSKEIFSRPNTSIDTNRRHKPHPSGVRPYIVGTQRAKDLLIEGRIRLTGNGPGRVHWYKSVRPDYWEQITSEIKAPHKTIKNRLVWQLRSGARNEALDGEVYALHAALSLKLHLLKPSQWDAMEKSLRQWQIFAQPAASTDVQTPAQSDDEVQEAPEAVEVAPARPAPPAPAPVAPERKSKGRSQRRAGGYSANNW